MICNVLSISCQYSEKVFLRATDFFGRHLMLRLGTFSDVNKATRYKAKIRHSKAKAKDWWQGQGLRLQGQGQGFGLQGQDQGAKCWPFKAKA